MRVHVIFTKFFLLLIAMLIYSRLTGYDLGLRELVGSGVTGSLLFYLYLLFTLIALSIVYLKKADTSSPEIFIEGLGLVIAGFFMVFFIVVLGFMSSEPFHIGEIVKFYIAPFAFYLLPIVALVSVFIPGRRVDFPLNEKKFAVLGIASFFLGLALYIVKSQAVLMGNVNAGMQILLVVLCLVLPSFYCLLGTVASFLKYRDKQKVAKEALLISLLGVTTFPLLSVFV